MSQPHPARQAGGHRGSVPIDVNEAETMEPQTFIALAAVALGVAVWLIVQFLVRVVAPQTGVNAYRAKPSRRRNYAQRL